MESRQQTFKNQEKELICRANRYALKVQNMVEDIVVDPHHIDADPNSTHRPNADTDLDPDPNFQIKAQTLKYC